MGARSKNFYNQIFAKSGYEAEAKTIQDLYLAGDKKAAEAAIPADYLAKSSLVGASSFVAERLGALKASGVTSLNVSLAGDSLKDRLHQCESLRRLVDDLASGAPARCKRAVIAVRERLAALPLTVDKSAVNGGVGDLGRVVFVHGHVGRLRLRQGEVAADIDEAARSVDPDAVRGHRHLATLARPDHLAAGHDDDGVEHLGVTKERAAGEDDGVGDRA